MIISFLNSKGGVGKTTISINVAESIARHTKKKVILVDTDPQQSAINWYIEDNVSFDIVSASTDKEIHSLKKQLDYDYIIIDGAATISNLSQSAIMVSDVVIIPVAPSLLDFSACGSIISMIETRNDLKPIKSKFLINKKVDGTKMYSSLKESMSDLEIGSLKTLISQRQSYIRTIANNQTIFNGSDNKAIAEIELLAQEIISL